MIIYSVLGVRELDGFRQSDAGVKAGVLDPRSRPAAGGLQGPNSAAVSHI